MTHASKRFHHRLMAGAAAVALTLGVAAQGAVAQGMPGASPDAGTPGAPADPMQQPTMQPDVRDQPGTTQPGMEQPAAAQPGTEFQTQDRTDLSSEDLRAVQQALNDAGHNAGPVDGIYGPRTAQALEEFQRQQGLTPSGEVDAQTMQQLGVDGGIGASDQPTQGFQAPSGG